MKTAKFLKAELLDLDGFLDMVEAYEEISAIRMRKVKKAVLSRREFLQGLNEAFSYIVYSYSVYKRALKKNSPKNILNTNGRNVIVLLSSNTGLYGDLILRIFSKFAEEVRSSDKNTDIVVTGALGKRLYDSSKLNKDYKYFELSDTASNDSNVVALLDYITDYTTINVFHGVFKSILVQDPEKTHLTGELMKRIEDGGNNNTIPSTGFIFEPSIEKVAEYFEKQILSLIFEQSVFESGLSKFASRMVSLDTAASNIATKVSSMGFELKKAKHRKTNLSIQEGVLGGALWN